MGSSGSGNFSDYAGSPNQASGGGGSSGGSSGTDVCTMAFSVELEDVAQYDFYERTENVPRKGDQLTLVLKKRIIAQDLQGVSVGALPTRYNYLAGCLKDGFQYTGIVHSSSGGYNPRVVVDFTAI